MRSVRHRVSVLEVRADRETLLRTRSEQDSADMKTDVNGLKRLMQAVSETQSDHGRMIRVLQSDVSILKSDVAILKSDVLDIKIQMVEMKLGINHIVSLLTNRINDEPDRPPQG